MPRYSAFKKKRKKETAQLLCLKVKSWFPLRWMFSPLSLSEAGLLRDPPLSRIKPACHKLTVTSFLCQRRLYFWIVSPDFSHSLTIFGDHRQKRPNQRQIGVHLESNIKYRDKTDGILILQPLFLGNFTTNNVTDSKVPYMRFWTLIDWDLFSLPPSNLMGT